MVRNSVDVRVVLFTGGEGTARIAAATAETAVRRGHRTVLLGSECADRAGLQIRPPQPLGWLDAAWPAVLANVVRAGEIPPLPGAPELQLWAQLQACLTDSQPDAAIVDCGPPDRAVGFLGLAESLPWLLDRAVPPQDHDAATLRGYGELLRAAAAVVRAAATVRIVLTAGADVLAQARSAAGRIAFHGYALDGIVAERLLPDGTDPWLAAESAQQRAALDALSAEFAKVPVHRLLWDQDPAQLYGPADPVAPGPAPDEPVVARDQGDYEWVLPMPYTTREQLDLARSGDDLIVTRGQDRRAFSLPSGLRRCTVVGAALRGDELRVRFQPDPALWKEDSGPPAPQASWRESGPPAPQASWRESGPPAPQASWRG